MIQAKFYYQDVLPNSGAKLDIAIHSGVDFLGLVKDTDFYDLKFGKNGQQIHKRLFRPSAMPKDGESEAEALTRSIDTNLRHVVKMLLLVKGDEFLATFEAADYDDFMSKASAALNEHKGFKVNLKVIPDNKSQKYPELGYFPNYVEAFVEGQEPTLKYSKSEEEKIQSYLANKEE